MLLQRITENISFQRGYAIISSLVFSLTILFLLLSSSGNLLIQSITAFLVLLGLFLVIGETFMIISIADKSNPIGKVLHRLAYSILITILIAYLGITFTTYASSFFLFGEASIYASILISSILITIYSTLGVCLTSLSYQSLDIEDVWRILLE